MRAGDLDRRIGLFHEGLSSGENNEFNEDRLPGGTVLAANVWASVKEVTGREFLADSQQVIGEARAVFTIRWRSDVSTQWQVKYNSVLWNIVSTREIGRREGLEIQAVRR
jgi:SPP1 family predicted phage head-tail adaptor